MELLDQKDAATGGDDVFAAGKTKQMQ